MKFIGVAKNGNLHFEPAIAEARRSFLASLSVASLIDETIIVYREPKTQKQLGAYFGLMIATAINELNNRGYDTSFLLKTPHPTGIGITVDLLKEYLYNVCPIFNEEGQRIGLSKANTEQTAKHFDDCRNFLASQWQIFVSEPDPLWREKSKKGE